MLLPMFPVRSGAYVPGLDLGSSRDGMASRLKVIWVTQPSARSNDIMPPQFPWPSERSVSEIISLA